MAVERKESWQYQGTVALPKGTLLALTTDAGVCAAATAVTDVPIGVLLSDVAAASATAPANVAVGSAHGEVYKAVASTAISIGAKVGATTGGKAVTITLTTTYAQEWIYGVAISAAGADGDLVSIVYGPQIAS